MRITGVAPKTVHSLPPEILVNIFQRLIPCPSSYNTVLCEEHRVQLDYRALRTLFALSHVSSHFRAAALSSALLWSDLPIEYPRTSVSVFPDYMTRRLLQRSQNQPLPGDLSPPPTPLALSVQWSRIASEEQVAAFVEFISHHSRRIVYLRIFDASPELIHALDFKCFLHDIALSISCLGIPPPTIILGMTLRSLHVHHVSFTAVSLRMLVNLHIVDAIKFTDFVQHLKDCPSLLVCSVCFDISPSNQAATLPLQIRHPLLRELTLDLWSSTVSFDLSGLSNLSILKTSTPIDFTDHSPPRLTALHTHGLLTPQFPAFPQWSSVTQLVLNVYIAFPDKLPVLPPSLTHIFFKPTNRIFGHETISISVFTFAIKILKTPPPRLNAVTIEGELDPHQVAHYTSMCFRALREWKEEALDVIQTAKDFGSLDTFLINEVDASHVIDTFLCSCFYTS